MAKRLTSRKIIMHSSFCSSARLHVMIHAGLHPQVVQPHTSTTDAATSHDSHSGLGETHGVPCACCQQAAATLHPVARVRARRFPQIRTPCPAPWPNRRHHRTQHDPWQYLWERAGSGRRPPPPLGGEPSWSRLLSDSRWSSWLRGLLAWPLNHQLSFLRRQQCRATSRARRSLSLQFIR